jgi:hypothetical protein
MLLLCSIVLVRVTIQFFFAIKSWKKLVYSTSNGSKSLSATSVLSASNSISSGGALDFPLAVGREEAREADLREVLFSLLEYISQLMCVMM